MSTCLLNGALLGVAIVGTSALPAIGQGSPSSVQDMILSQLRSETFLTTDESRQLDASYILVDTTASYQGISVYTISVVGMNDGSRDLFVVAETGSKLFRVYGFQSNEIPALANSVALETATHDKVMQLSRALAFVASRRLGRNIVFPFGPNHNNERDPTKLPDIRFMDAKGDTVVAVADGNLLVRVTVLAMTSESVWFGTTYSFEFTTAGRLLAWASGADHRFSP